MSLINLEQLGMVLNAISSKIKSVRGNWNQNDPNADNYIQNRTHYETVEDVTVEKTLTITWDGNTDGKVQATEDGELIPMYKISDEILTEEQLHDATCTMNGYTAPLKDMWDDELANGNVICREDITAFMNPPLCAVRAENVNIDGTSIVFPEPGIYSVNSGNGNYFSRIETTHTVMEKVNVVHYLDPKYIKDMYYNTSDVEETVLVNNLTFDSYDAGDAPQCNFIPEQKYSVIWNGTRYDNLVCYFDGEYNIIADGESVPFYIDDDGGDALYINPEFETVTIIQLKEEEEIHQIDEKYIPDTIARNENVICVSDVAILDGGRAPFGIPGLYDANYNLIADWDELTNKKGILFDYDYDYSTCTSSPSSIQYHLQSTYKDAINGSAVLVFDDTISYLGAYLFYQCSELSGIIFPGKEFTIGSDAFSGCGNLTHVVYKRGMTSVGYMFSYCSGLNSIGILGSGASIELPSTIERIENGAYGNMTNLTTVTIPSSITYIGQNAFSNCGKLQSVIFGDNISIDTISDHMLSGCNKLQNIKIPDSVTNIEFAAFMGCKSLNKVSLSDNNQLTTIGSFAFYNTGLYSVGLPGSGASFELPRSVTTIANSAFSCCDSLSSVVLHENITSIHQSFGASKNLRSVTILAETPPAVSGGGLFGGCSSSLKIKVPANSVSAYKAAEGWKDYASKIIAIT